MKLQPKKKKAASEENLVPLINVVFLMLIFFLAAGALRPFREEGIKAPQATVSGHDERPLGPVLINASGKVSIKGVEQDKTVLVAFFAARVRSHVTQPLPIVADQHLPAIKLVEVLQAARSAGIKKIRLVTRKRKAQ